MPAATTTASLGMRPSVLYASTASREATEIADDAWHDLALDQVEADLAARIGERLARVLRRPLASPNDLHWRHGVFRDLRDEHVLEVVTTFRGLMRESRTLAAATSRSHDVVEAALGHLRAVAVYLDAELTLARTLPAALADRGDASAALTQIAAHVVALAERPDRAALRDRVARLQESVASVRSALWINGTTIVVGPYDDEPDDVTPVLDTFARFRTGRVPPAEMEVPRGTDGDHVQQAVLDLVAHLHPAAFDPVVQFAHDVPDATDPVVARFDDEIRFYLAILELYEPLEKLGLPVCLPVVTDTDTDTDNDNGVRADGLYDVVLARTLESDRHAAVTNDIDLGPGERLVVITGPNQGGKTTMARALGQLHHLASAGVPVPAAAARVPLTDHVLTHFDRPERLDNLQGRLGEDLTRLHDLLQATTPRSLVVLNEAFASTTLADATYLNREILRRVRHTGARSVCVTFIDELTMFDDATVCLVAEIDADDPTRRTFRLTRRAADGRAYALALAEKYRLTPVEIADRIHAHDATDDVGAQTRPADDPTTRTAQEVR